MQSHCRKISPGLRKGKIHLLYRKIYDKQLSEEHAIRNILTIKLPKCSPSPTPPAPLEWYMLLQSVIAASASQLETLVSDYCEVTLVCNTFDNICS